MHSFRRKAKKRVYAFLGRNVGVRTKLIGFQIAE
jgi:hypothetical protein